MVKGLLFSLKLFATVHDEFFKTYFYVPASFKKCISERIRLMYRVKLNLSKMSRF